MIHDIMIEFMLMLLERDCPMCLKIGFCKLMLSGLLDNFK